MELRELVQKMDELVAKGAIVEAVDVNFCDFAKTSDYGGTATTTKAQMVEKMKSFTAGIVKINEITHHQTLLDGNVSASEFTFDFDMKDGSQIHWHEIIQREWGQDGKVVKEEYFKAD
ncbi:hypothetical protein [Aureispira anguillae]|uniref:SnoaL-like domain-containing protein n=1 Tax=Aureispira anguillae TaxID=2864201 RepID=A0A915YFL9_9BACT|nr:hypothetical protein [Aureispira anguillae]BDS12238.1 hypothetical protein AsAng_0029570 [Aureispira anguillae]